MKLYMSKSGDTLTLIAHKKQLPLQDLLLVNPHWSASEILASGSKVKVPGAAIRIANEETEDEHQHEHRQKLYHVDVEQFFAPYYAYQKRWLEHLERYHSPQHENCQPLGEEKDEHNKQHEHHQHDEVEEDNTHVPKKRKRSTKLRKRKRKSVKKQRIAPHQHHEVEEQCEDDQVLPWLNV